MAKEKEPKPTETAETSESKPKKSKEEKAPVSTESTPKKGKEEKAPTPVSTESAPQPTATTAADVVAVKKKGFTPGRGPRRGKKLRNHLKNIEQKLTKEGVQPLKKALSTLKTLKRAKFDETVEVHIKLGIDTTNSEQMVRGSVPLPHGIGKSVRIVVFCQGDDVAKAKEAGADFVGSDEIIKKIQSENWLDFDVALATQGLMGQVSRLGKILGPRNLMPTPKAGTVIPSNGDVAAAVKEFKAGKVEYRADKSGNIHAGVGKLSFDEDKLAANIQAFVDQVRAAKPSSVRGHYVQSITVSATMSPGIQVNV
jgi:large subunit ribosomal protein L1